MDNWASGATKHATFNTAAADAMAKMVQDSASSGPLNRPDHKILTTGVRFIDGPAAVNLPKEDKATNDGDGNERREDDDAFRGQHHTDLVFDRVDEEEQILKKKNNNNIKKDDVANFDDDANFDDVGNMEDEAEDSGATFSTRWQGTLVVGVMLLYGLVAFLPHIIL